MKSRRACKKSWKVQIHNSLPIALKLLGKYRNIMLNYFQLETLKAIDEHGTLEAAARALRVSSFAVGRRIRQLEKALGVKLLERAPTRVSEVGKILCDHLSQVVLLENEILDEAQEDIRQVLDNLPSYKIALPEEIATGAFIDIIKQLKQNDDPSRFDITICDLEKSSILMQSGEVAAAISIRKTPIHGFKTYSLKEITYKVVASPHFIQTHFPNGITEESLISAPSLNDGLNKQWVEHVLGKTCTLSCYRSELPSMTVSPLLKDKAWSLIPNDEAQSYLEDGSLMELQSDVLVTRQLYWHISTAKLEKMKTITDKIRQNLG